MSYVNYRLTHPQSQPMLCSNSKGTSAGQDPPTALLLTLVLPPSLPESAANSQGRALAAANQGDRGKGLNLNSQSSSPARHASCSLGRPISVQAVLSGSSPTGKDWKPAFPNCPDINLQSCHRNRCKGTSSTVTRPLERGLIKAQSEKLSLR